MRVRRLHRVAPLYARQLRNHQLRYQPSDDIDEKQTQELFSQPNDVHAHEGDVEEVGEGYYELVDEKFYYYAVFIRMIGEVLLVLGEAFGERAVDLLVEDVGHQHVHKIGNLRPASR